MNVFQLWVANFQLAMMSSLIALAQDGFYAGINIDAWNVVVELVGTFTPLPCPVQPTCLAKHLVDA